MVGVAAADMSQTCWNLARGGHEINLTQSCAKDIAITAGFDAAALGGARLLHRMGHERLARVPMRIVVAVVAIEITSKSRYPEPSPIYPQPAGTALHPAARMALLHL